jgi:hypothetical protein
VLLDFILVGVSIMLNAIAGDSDEEKQFEEDYIRSYAESLYDVDLSIDYQPDAPHWLSHYTVDDYQFITQCREACGVWDTTDDFIRLDNETGMVDGNYHKVHSERIGEELELQDEDGTLWYVGFPMIIGLYVRVPEDVDDVDNFIDSIEPNTARYIR